MSIKEDISFYLDINPEEDTLPGVEALIKTIVKYKERKINTASLFSTKVYTLKRWSSKFKIPLETKKGILISEYADGVIEISDKAAIDRQNRFFESLSRIYEKTAYNEWTYVDTNVTNSTDSAFDLFSYSKNNNWKDLK